MKLYRLCTMESPEVKSATGTEYLVRDESWDGVLRRAVVSERSGKPVPGHDTMHEEVLQERAKAVPDRKGNEEFVYGFAEGESLYGNESSAYGGWVDASLRGYRERLVDDIAGLSRARESLAVAVASADGQVGEPGFGDSCVQARKSISSLRGKVESFKRDWPGLDIAEIPDAERSIEESEGMVAEAESRNHRALDDAENARRREEVEDGLCSLDKSLKGLEGEVGSLLDSIGTDAFAGHLKAAEGELAKVQGRLDAAERRWLADYKMQVPELADVKARCEDVAVSIAKSRPDHATALAEAEERRRRAERAARRRRRMFAAVAIMLLGVALCVGASFHFANKNKESFEQARRFYGIGKFASVRDTYSRMYDIPFLRVRKGDYFKPGFDERLSLAAMADERRKSVGKCANELSRWEDGAQGQSEFSRSIAREIGDAQRKYREYADLQASVTFDAVRLGTVDIESVLAASLRCEERLNEARASVDKTSRNAEADRKCKELEDMLADAERARPEGQTEQVVELLKKAERAAGGIILPDGCDNAYVERLAKVKNDIKECIERIRAAQVAGFVKEAREWFNAKNWEECIKAADKAIALDPENVDAKTLKKDAEKEVEAIKEEAERKAREDAERKAREEAKRKAREEAEHKAREEAERKAQEDAKLASREAYAARMKAEANDVSKWAKTEWKSAESSLMSATEEFRKSNYKQATSLFVKAKGGFDEATRIAKGAMRTGVCRTITLPGGVKMEMIYCAPGEFLMGSPSSEERRCQNETQHRVKLTKGFWLGKYEVTQAQWRSVMGNNPSHWKGDELPVEDVSWDDCKKFIDKVNETLGDGVVRLPTEAEWEYACRAGSTTAYSWGDALNGESANCDGYYPYGTTVKGPYLNKTAPVGKYNANAWGFHDMHGNVWEWCNDRYGEYPMEDAIDPTGPAFGSNRVLRGGGWYSSSADCRSAYRDWYESSQHYNHSGFRLCCSTLPD